MVFSACKRVPKLNSLRSFFDLSTYGVRRNDSHELFSTKSSVTIFKESTSRDVNALLVGYGFKKTHISELKTRSPIIFSLNAQRNILPKLNYLTSIGLSKTDLPKLVLSNIYLLASSLQKKIIPSCNFLLNCVPLTNDQLVRALKCYPCILMANVDKVLAPNVTLLREIGLSPPEIASMIFQSSSSPAICRNHEAFKIYVDKVFSLGIQPSTRKFLRALKILCGMSEERLNQRMALYKSYGISDDEIQLAFRKQPTMMGLSDDNISQSMKFFIDELKWKPSFFIVRTPEVVCLNLDRVVRRSRVLEKLVEKGLKREDHLCTPSFLKLGERRFLNMFIDKYKDDAPEILDIYNRGKSRRREK